MSDRIALSWVIIHFKNVTTNGASQLRRRVIEIPTPRWIVYDAFRYGVEIPKDARKIHQERAYTSPIWYTPKY